MKGALFSVPLLVDAGEKSFVNNESIDLAIALARLDGADVAASADALLGGLSEEEMVAEMRKHGDAVASPPYKFIKCATEDERAAVVEGLTAEFTAREELLGARKFVLGDHLTLADASLWSKLVRYDNVYCRQFGLGEKFALLTSWPHLLAYVRRVAAACPRLVDELQMPLINKIYWQSGTYSPLCGNDPTSPVPATIELFDA